MDSADLGPLLEAIEWPAFRPAAASLAFIRPPGPPRRRVLDSAVADGGCTAGCTAAAAVCCPIFMDDVVVEGLLEGLLAATGALVVSSESLPMEDG